MASVTILKVLSSRMYSYNNIDQLKLFNRIKDDNVFSGVFSAIGYLEKALCYKGKTFSANDLLNVDDTSQLRINCIDNSIVYLVRYCLTCKKENFDLISNFMVRKIEDIISYLETESNYKNKNIIECLRELIKLANRCVKRNEYDGANSSFENEVVLFSKSYYAMMYRLYANEPYSLAGGEYNMYMTYNYNMLFSNAGIDYNNGSYESK